MRGITAAINGDERPVLGKEDAINPFKVSAVVRPADREQRQTGQLSRGSGSGWSISKNCDPHYIVCIVRGRPFLMILSRTQSNLSAAPPGLDVVGPHRPLRFGADVLRGLRSNY